MAIDFSVLLSFIAYASSGYARFIDNLISVLWAHGGQEQTNYRLKKKYKQCLCCVTPTKLFLCIASTKSTTDIVPSGRSPTRPARRRFSNLYGIDRARGYGSTNATLNTLYVARQFYTTWGLLLWYYIHFSIIYIALFYANTVILILTINWMTFVNWNVICTLLLRYKFIFFFM